MKATEQDLAEVETLLWQGKVDTAIEQLSHWQDDQAQIFIGYLTHHQTRIVNYAYFKAEGISIGSGAIESTVKQIGARMKLSGAQWKLENVPQALLHRYAYLNGQFPSWDLQDWDAPNRSGVESNSHCTHRGWVMQDEVAASSDSEFQ